MKILIYGDYYKWKSGFGREIRDILPYLKVGNEVRQVALGYNGFPIDQEMIVYHTKTPEVKDYYAQEVLHYAIDDFKPDIVLTVGDFFSLPKISFTLAHPGTFKWVHWGTLDSEPLDFYSRESLRWMHYCLPQSEFAKGEILKVNKDIPMEVLYPSVDPKVFYKLDKSKEELKKEFKLEGLDVYICNSRGQQRKNVPVLLESFKMLVKERPKSVLILSSGITNTKTDSGGVDGYDLDRFVTEFGLNDNVLLPRTTDHGPVPDDVLNIQYNLADINLLPSWGEGFGLSIIEAGICHVPTIGTNCSAIEELITGGTEHEYRGWLVSESAHCYNNDGSKYSLVNPKRLYEIMKQAIESPDLIKESGENAYKFAKELTPESRSNKLLELFQRLLKEKSEPLARK